MNDRPNIVFLHVDQMHRDAISAYGCDHATTPRIDRIVHDGHSFMKSYATMPQCVPARTSWFTGRMSKEHGSPTNAFAIDPTLPDLGGWLRRHRTYRTVYAGKWHVNGRRVTDSFELLTHGHGMGEYSDSTTARAAVSFLRNYRDEHPFFLSVGLFNPHDCCYASGAAGGMGKFGFAGKIPDELPELPGSFNACYDRNSRGRTADWSVRDWRYYCYEYARMVEAVDAEVGRIYEALRSSRFAENTLFIFASDHGDGAGYHAKVSKGFLYDEAWRVPTVVSWPGRIPGGRRDEAHLASGVDIPATICDYAGAPPLPKMTIGRSWRPIFEDEPVEWRSYVVGETRIGPLRTAIRDASHKTIFHADGTTQVFDMEADPLETNDLAGTRAVDAVVDRHRAQFRDYVSRIAIYRGPARISEGKRNKVRREALAAQIEEYCDWYDRVARGEGEWAN